ncbi:MAG: peptidoglycan bridge formation glycyltransferase FemA/FemB family protein [Candidatus Magasanikbacteria bacterium]|nr:peptidoglycan bridge formation glycyltransferase FemA/FemB family protein [Candidatus Magasanikbacteria bacterium]
MEYTIREIPQKEDWEAWIRTQPYTLFVQSPTYGKFFQLLGEQYWIFGIYNEKNTLIGGSLVLSTHAKRGNFLYVPYGPYIALEHHHAKAAAFKAYTTTLKLFAKKQGYAFIRMSPFWRDTKENTHMLKDAGYRPAPMHALAETTWMLPVTAPEDVLLQGMKKNHRNLIRRCIKEGVTVTMHTDIASVDTFNTLHNTTAKRHKFSRFSPDYITKEFTAFAQKNQAVVYHAYLPDGTLDSSAIIFFYHGMAVYRHGASLNTDHKIPTSYLIQWHAIQEAKKRGMKWYNFWGIAPQGASPAHPFHGITHFKTGFGGEEKQLVSCQDYVLSSWYWINWIIETCRRFRRGFQG